MSYEIVLQSEAVIEIQKAFEWHEHRQAGLGYDFIEEPEDGFGRLSRHPYNYSVINHKYRKLRLNAFLI